MCDIELISANISALEFSENFLHKNVPCLIENSLTNEWKARALWQVNGRPNFEYLKKEFGSSLVPVADCNDLCFSTHPKTTWSLNEYLNYWEQFNETLLACNNSTSDPPPVKYEKRLLYMKDWHFTRDFPSYEAYNVPEIFSSDWLNEIAEEGPQGDDYRFVYMGPNGTWTPFHADVLRSYSWSVNICGCKEWLIFPPGQEELLKDKYGNLPVDVTECDSKPLRVIQEAGQAIFIPSGWYHQVKNIGDTISINHNWINVFGIDYTWKYLTSELNLVEQQIDDCKEMEGWSEQCQLILKNVTGMDFNDFYKFLFAISQTRLKKLKETTKELSQQINNSSVRHFLFDLLSDEIKLKIR